MIKDHELQWNDAIENDGSGGEFVLLEPGEYPFAVVAFERARFGGSPKLPACNQAKLTLEVGEDGNVATLNHNLYLHSKTEGLLCQFFRSIGARKHGERLVMDWSRVVGARGRCKIKHRKWVNNKDGREMVGNDVDKFLDPADPAGQANTIDDAFPPSADPGNPPASGDGFVPF